MTYLKDFRKKLEENDYPGFLKIWEEYCYSDEIDEDEFIKILQETKASDLSQSFGRHVDRSLLLWRIMKEPKKKATALKLIFDIQTVNSEELAEIAYDYLKTTYPDDKFFDEKLRIIGLRGKENFQGVISGYDLLSHLTKGKFVYHTAGWGTGEILDVSIIREDVNIEFEYVLGSKSFSFKNALKTLIPLPDEHFLAHRFGNPDALEKEAKNDTLKVIHLLLQDLGPKTSQEIKDELCELVIPEKDWSRWWQIARSKMKKDTKIAIPKSSKEPFKLLKEGVAHEDILYEALEKKPLVKQALHLIYSFMRDFSESLKNEDIKKTLRNKIEDILEDHLSNAEKLQLYFLLEDLGKREEFISNIIQQSPTILDLIEEIEIISLKKRSLMEIKKLRSDWQDIFFSLFFSLQQNMLRDYLLSELLKNSPSSIFEEKLNELVYHPYYYPFLYVWYFQKILEEKEALPYSDKEGRIKFFEGFLILLDHIERKKDYKELTKKMASILISKRYKIVRKIFEEASLENIKEFLLLSSKCNVLSDHDKKIIHSLATVVYPSLKNFQSNDLLNPKEEFVIWTTEKGYKKIQKRIKEITEHETLENAKEIKEARSHGDLRENAEYKAALEKRAQLQGELKLLSEQINKAQILTKEQVMTDRVGVGTVVICEADKGETKIFTLLGPWDANPEKNILSFNSKVAQMIKDKTEGESFNFQGKTYKIKKISNYFS